MIGFSAQAQEFSLEIPAGQSLEIDLPDMDLYRAYLRNSPSSTLEVSVRERNSGEQLRGLGLSPSAKADLLVERDAYLNLQNNSEERIKVKLSVKEETRGRKDNNQAQYVDLVLLNRGLKSIPLLIPGAMNPNLSPMSRSNVSLKLGQEILFRMGWKRHVLLVVSEDLEPGTELDISKLLNEKKKELGSD